ncbi:hypothetical protein MXB_4898 [Myxobolus squamalis]|nr:hypothetical protein MXB_4898 [Myxobolus squamalis]
MVYFKSSMIQLQILLDNNEIYTEEYYPITFESIRVLVIDGRTLLFSSSRIYYVDDTDLSDDLNDYFEKIYHDNIVIIVTLKRTSQINEAVLATLFQSKNCNAKAVNNEGVSVVSYVKNDHGECFVKELNSNAFVLKLFLSEFKASKLNFDCFKEKGNEEESKRRIEFCNRFFAFPEYCRCATPFPISVDLVVKNEDALSQIPILIMGSNRPADNVHNDMIIVDIDQETPELVGVIKLFNVKQKLHSAVCSGECRISEHYRMAFTNILNQFPPANNVFIFEDDLISSSDIFNYFSSKLDVYLADSSIFCVSAWNDQAYIHSVGDLTMSYRIQHMPGLGLVLSRKIIQNLVNIWPVKRKMNWDAWIRESVISRRVCIIPDVSRTFHIGKFGLHSSSHFQKAYFSRRFFLTQINIKEYDSNVNKNLKIEQLVAKSKKVFLSTRDSKSTFILLFKYLYIFNTMQMSLYLGS